MRCSQSPTAPRHPKAAHGVAPFDSHPMREAVEEKLDRVRHSGPSATNQTISHYRIIEKLGAGGMGEVYLAEDTLLGRNVAIKFPSAESSVDPHARKRLVREAQAAAKLDHPNICTIYEVSEEAGRSFIVMEYLEGETLACRIRSQPLELGECLEIAAQVAAALAEAHSRDIIHRDIKPMNIILTAHHQAKVMDFGLAEIIRDRSRVDSEGVTESLLIEPGAIVGTLRYMSPEQVRGESVDARSDIFSLGVVLYEMLTGRQPFARASAAETIAAIQMIEPAPLRSYRPEVPEALQDIVERALQKDREKRYQTARELLIDLKDLKHRLEFEKELQCSSPSDTGEGERHSPFIAANEPAGTVPAQRTYRAEYILSAVKRHKTGVAVISAATLLTMIAIGVGLYRFAGRNQSQPAATKTIRASNLNPTRLTGSGKVQNATVSPDGKYIVYAVKDGAQQSLWLRQVAVTSNVQQIQPPAKVQYLGETFSPDGNFIYYVATDGNNPAGALYQMPVLGGTPRKVLTRISSPITFSPDATRIAFVRYEEHTTGEYVLMIADADGTNERQLAVRGGQESEWFAFGGPGWSPDGKEIAVPGGSAVEDFRFFVIVVDAESGAQKEISSQKFLNVGRVCWLADKSGMVVSATTQQSNFKQIWFIAYPGGEARQITRDLNDYDIGVSLTADSKSLVTVQNDIAANIWVGPFSNPGLANQITSGRRDGRSGHAWAPDGRIVYNSHMNGHPDIWVMNADGTNQRPLTDDPHRDYRPTVSPDDRYIVFGSNRAGNLSLWRMDIDGGNLKQLTGGPDDFFSQISPDGRWVVFDSTVAEKGTLWKIPIEGGEPVQLTDKCTFTPSVSPDGKFIACYYREQPDSPVKVLVMPFEGGEPLKIFDLPISSGKEQTDIEGPVVWTPEGRAIIYLDARGGIRNLWRQALDGGKPVQLTNFTSNGIKWFALSRDGKQIALTRETVTSDVVLLSDFR